MTAAFVAVMFNRTRSIFKNLPRATQIRNVYFILSLDGAEKTNGTAGTVEEERSPST